MTWIEVHIVGEKKGEYVRVAFNDVHLASVMPPYAADPEEVGARVASPWEKNSLPVREAYADLQKALGVQYVGLVAAP